jgi:fructokinase
VSVERRSVAAVGEILWDVFPDSVRLGGAPLNFGVHARRLGHPVYLLSAVGADDRGRQATREIGALGLDTSFIETSAGLPTGTATVELSTETTCFTIHRPAAYDGMQLAGKFEQLKDESPDWLYFGTLFPSMPAGRAFLDRLFDELEGAVKFYDLNLRSGADSPDLVKQLLKRADVVKFNEDELIRVHEFSNLPSSVEGFCREGAARYGWRAVAVTLGARGCALLADEKYVEEEGCPVKLADSVGAGDAFAAAFVHGLSLSRPVREIAAFANRVGALVASRHGAIPDWTLEEVASL